MSPKAQRRALKARNEVWMRKVWEERGQKAPISFEQDLADDDTEGAPELSWLEQRYLQLFNLASTCRPAAFSGALPLPYLAVAEVLDRNLLAGTEFESAMYVILKMDEEMRRLWDLEADKLDKKGNK